MDSYVLHWAVILCSHVIFSLRLPGFGQREPLQPASVPCWHALIVVLKPMLMFCLTKMLQAHLALSLPWPKNWLFLQGDLFPFSVEWLPQTFLWLREKQNLFRAHLSLSKCYRFSQYRNFLHSFIKHLLHPGCGGCRAEQGTEASLKLPTASWQSQTSQQIITAAS